MSNAARVVGVAAVAALLVLAAVAYSGHLVSEDFCTPSVEGSSGHEFRAWAPPGLRCEVHDAADGKVLHAERTGSWPVFLATLLVGLGVIVAVVRRRRSGLPGWIRLSADAALAFAVGGAGVTLIGGGWYGAAVMTMVYGVPAAGVADYGLRAGRRSPVAGLAGAAVAFCAAIVADVLWLYGLGVAAYGLTILLVAAVAALPWRAIAPRSVADRN